MINRKNPGGRCIRPTLQERGQALILVPLELPKGGSRWINTSLNGGVVYGY